VSDWLDRSASASMRLTWVCTSQRRPLKSWAAASGRVRSRGHPELSQVCWKRSANGNQRAEPKSRESRKNTGHRAIGSAC